MSFRSLALATLFASATAAIPFPAARAGTSDQLVRLSALRARVTSARGPLAYGALRRVWAEWDRGDPTPVEEVLFEVAHDAGEPAPVRAYAGLLEAYSRRRRGDLEGARTRIARLGYVDQWMLLGPFDNDGKTGFSRDDGPEADQTGPLNLTRDYEGKDHRLARWRLLPQVSPYGWVDFASFVRPIESVCVYTTTFVRDAFLTGQATRPVSIWAGASGALRILWNGAEVLSDEKYRDLDSDRFAVTVSLASGWNRLTVKTCGDDRPPMLSLRIADATGNPDEHIVADAEPMHSTHDGGAVGLAPKAAAPVVPQGVKGPVQAFERLVGGGDPAILEGYARYLQVTGADDPTEHRARELARMAAEKAPTISRLLLAGDVAESRNQRAAWIERAEALVAKGHATREETVQVLLARAEYARGGVNPRDAVPYCEQVLALEPDNLPATLAKVELYENAGLRDTALAELDRALSLRPRSVGLLRAMVAALRDRGRDTEADEMADRYAALRFDDPSFLRSRIEVAVARRQVSVASQLIGRLLATNPDSAAALQTAAQAWMRLGDHARAVASYRVALEIAPEDTEIMKQLAAAHALAGERDAQVNLLKRVLELMPQAKEVRDELAHIGPGAPRPDEQYARPASEFLAQRAAASGGQARRSLVDLQVTTVFPNGLASRFRQVVYQPLTEASAAESREYGFGFESDSQTVQLRAARVYRADGRVEEAVESGAGAMADDPAVAIYTSTRSYYVRFPRLEPGDIVELQYRVEDVAPRNEFADYFGEVVYMQGSEPIGRSEYVLLTPKSRTLYFNEPRVPGLKRTVEERGDQRIFHFVAINVAGVKEEALQPPWPEVLGHVNVSTYRTWGDMGRWYWGLVKDQFVPDDEVRQRAEALTRGLKDDASKARAIYDYVVQKTRYVALEFGIHGYKPYRCAQIFARGFGDCKDKATLIVTMLGALGIHATPVIVRTATKGDIETVPASLAPFDHMIAYVPSLDLYLDGTAEYTGALELPAMDRGAMALRVNEGDAVLVHLPDPPAAASVHLNKLDASLGPDGAAQLDWRADVTGVSASEWRVRFHADDTRKQRVQQLLAQMLPGSEVTAVDSGDLEDIEQRVTMHVRGNVPQFGRSEGDNVTIPVGRREHMIRDYAPLPARQLDVRLHARWTEEDDWTVRLPSGAKVRSVPTASRASSPFGSYAVDVETEGSLVRVRTSVTLLESRVLAKDYPAFRRWCEEVDRALGQRALVDLRSASASSPASGSAR